MNYEITPVEKGEKVEFKNPIKDFYNAIGGEAGMQKLMYSFYDQDEDEFEQVKVKNTKFFVEICGGPKIYNEDTKGMELNEFMVRLHDDFSITEKSRVEWLGTMEEALRELEDIDEALIQNFWDYLENFSKLTVNTFPDGSTYYANV
ncbi:Hemoglobin-like protein HbO [hydrothermal vent metagenome]|uniref:Hemoglobin-like protein HbO n=1 Tax=hydrothermal vent metagenome TaxID=652676 RepID=A0A1W1CBM6_9ZZZZ